MASWPLRVRAAKDSRASRFEFIAYTAKRPLALLWRSGRASRYWITTRTIWFSLTFLGIHNRLSDSDTTASMLPSQNAIGIAYLASAGPPSMSARYVLHPVRT